MFSTIIPLKVGPYPNSTRFCYHVYFHRRSLRTTPLLAVVVRSMCVPGNLCRGDELMVRLDSICSFSARFLLFFVFFFGKPATCPALFLYCHFPAQKYGVPLPLRSPKESRPIESAIFPKNLRHIFVFLLLVFPWPFFRAKKAVFCSFCFFCDLRRSQGLSFPYETNHEKMCSTYNLMGFDPTMAKLFCR